MPAHHSESMRSQFSRLLREEFADVEALQVPGRVESDSALLPESNSGFGFEPAYHSSLFARRDLWVPL
jgi:hypothetical protein